MSASVKIPSSYSFNTTMSGGLDMDLDNIRIKEIPKISTESKIDTGLDNIRVKELPRIDIQTSMKPTRVHMPVNLRFGVSTLGMELLAFSVCGESMVIVEDYHPHETESCA
ncbi:MAG TPA: hypothetical protein VJL28_13495 [Gemmatimonadaceae bacterium]|nr:hypothetical protein [Gemmatimonadaceae bacterium]